MRDRLIELVDKAKKEYANDVTDHTETEYIVEGLLNHGVIVPPCKEEADEVVRCKDCKNYKQNPYCAVEDMMCMFWGDWLPTDNNDFCSWGEKRTKAVSK